MKEIHELNWEFAYKIFLDAKRKAIERGFKRMIDEQEFIDACYVREDFNPFIHDCDIKLTDQLDVSVCGGKPTSRKEQVEMMVEYLMMIENLCSLIGQRVFSKSFINDVVPCIMW
jgi:hypothetical protein